MSEKVLVYLGASLPLARAREILPEAIYHPPARQGDIVSDVVNLNPTHILLVEGSFRENLSVWHKELVFALQYPGVKGVYGASSMGALRAAELDWIGMIGVGLIYQWYRDGVTEDDSEVAVSYAELPSGDYKCLTVPLVDIRAGVAAVKDNKAEAFLAAARRVHYADRTKAVCETLWGGSDFPLVPQKALDAIELLETFRELKPAPKVQPSSDHLSRFFHALYDRDRRIKINGAQVPQQHIEAYVLLFHPEWERICWDASNQELALMLCDHFLVTVSIEEVERENQRFQQRCGIETALDFEMMLENNGWTRGEYDRLMIQNARIRKLQHANTVAKMYRRNTRSILDYLRTHQAFDYWATQATKLEGDIEKSGVDDWLSVNLEKTAFALLSEHFDREGLELKMLPEEYLLETGFSNNTELSVALERIKAGKEEQS
jgi:hypothetical protein